jgi:hypothetical protein
MDKYSLMFSKDERNDIAGYIEKDIFDKFGWEAKMNISENGEVSCNSIQGEDRYDLYPNVSEEAADEMIIVDIQNICRKYISGIVIDEYTQLGRKYCA